MTSLTMSDATTGSIPRRTYMPRNSAASPSGLRRSERRSTSSSRSISSRWAVMERYSPAAMEKDPATRPAMPASRTIDAARIGPGDAQDQGHVGDQAVADAEDGGPGTAAPHVTVVVHLGEVVLVRRAHRRQRSEVPPRG